ncbi:MAG: hypothetical protein ACJ8F7_17055 [Gemmataceae bacterium]
MAKGRTLWEMFTGLFDTPAEPGFFNPLRAKPGAGFTIDNVEWRDHNFRLDEIRDYRRHIRGQEFSFADYVLVDRPLHADEVRVRLRVNPVADPAVAGVSQHALLLHLEDDLAYSKELHDAVKSDTKSFQIHHDGGETEDFYRLNDVADSYKADEAVIRDGKEVQKLRLEYWDYSRDVPDAAGQPTTEYLFVEMDSDSGWFQLWRGVEVDPHKVVVM